MKETRKWLKETIEKEIALRQPADISQPVYDGDKYSLKKFKIFYLKQLKTMPNDKDIKQE